MPKKIEFSQESTKETQLKKTDSFIHETIEKEVKVRFGDVLSSRSISKLFECCGLEGLSKDFVNRLRRMDLMQDDIESPHFQDSLEIASMVDKVVTQQKGESEEEFKERKNNLRIASLFHDIGKTGPEGITEKEQRAFLHLFNLYFYGVYKIKQAEDNTEKEVTVFGLPITDAYKVKKEEMVFNQKGAEKEAELVNKILSEKEFVIQGKKLSSVSTMYEYFGAHVYWTADILKKEQESNKNINEEMIENAACHHWLDGRNPLGIKPGEKTDAELDSFVVIELVDKYHAFFRRSKMKHADVVAMLLKIIEGKIKITGKSETGEDICKIGEVEFKDIERVKNIYLSTLEKINSQEDVLLKSMELDKFVVKRKLIQLRYDMKRLKDNLSLLEDYDHQDASVKLEKYLKDNEYTKEDVPIIIENIKKKISDLEKKFTEKKARFESLP